MGHEELNDAEQDEEEKEMSWTLLFWRAFVVICLWLLVCFFGGIGAGIFIRGCGLALK